LRRPERLEVQLLKGKRALVTGSTQGIGLAIARALAAQGCSVMLHGLAEPDRLQALREEVATAHGVDVDVHGADLSQVDQIEDLVQATARALGGLDLLVNNAGIQYTAPVETFPAERWDRILAVTLSSAFHTTRLAVPGMRGQGWGRIINIASAHALVASVHKAAYVAAKHGLAGLTRVVALETAGSGITCNAICPGWVRTDLVEPQIAARAQALGVSLEEGARHLLAEKQPSRQFVTVEQIACVAIFLCSDGAAQITGAAMPIDGGWTAQ
jgi:3-hydroxybutyrate dehydrogenase